MQEPPLTQAQQALMTLMRTPYVESAVKMMRIAQTIVTAEEPERVGLMTLYLQAFFVDRRDEPNVADLPTFTVEEAWRAVQAFDACVADGTVEFERLMDQGLPVRDVAAQLLRQLELLRPHGPIVQGWFLEQIAGHKNFPYVEADQVPQPVNRSSERLLSTLERRPLLFSRLYRICATHFDHPVILGGCIRQLLADEADHVQDAVIGWAYGVRQQFQRRAARRNYALLLQASLPARLTPEQRAQRMALRMDTSDKKKVD